MKRACSICGLFITFFCSAQVRHIEYQKIDRDVRNIEGNSLSELAEKLTTPYQTDFEKARAIFSWVAQNISYRPRQARPVKKNTGSKTTTPIYETDTATILLPREQVIASDVLRKKQAVCSGYSSLFKTLCDYAGITSAIVNGYARGDFNQIGPNFRTNHSWNAVKLDSAWYLVDVTWASGYFVYNSNEFIKDFDDKYFLCPPERFAQDHFPDDVGWLLLTKPPLLGEFQISPYKSKSFIKYNIRSYWPMTGIIRASVGDTVVLYVHHDISHERRIGGGSIYDSTEMLHTPTAVICWPSDFDSLNLVNYRYVPQSVGEQWLELVYNDDIILRYKLDIREK